MKNKMMLTWLLLFLLVDDYALGEGYYNVPFSEYILSEEDCDRTREDFASLTCDELGSDTNFWAKAINSIATPDTFIRTAYFSCANTKNPASPGLFYKSGRHLGPSTTMEAADAFVPTTAIGPLRKDVCAKAGEEGAEYCRQYPSYGGANLTIYDCMAKRIEDRLLGGLCHRRKVGREILVIDPEKPIKHLWICRKQTSADARCFSRLTINPVIGFPNLSIKSLHRIPLGYRCEQFGLIPVTCSLLTGLRETSLEYDPSVNCFETGLYQCKMDTDSANDSWSWVFLERRISSVNGYHGSLAKTVTTQFVLPAYLTCRTFSPPTTEPECWRRCTQLLFKLQFFDSIGMSTKYQITVRDIDSAQVDIADDEHTNMACGSNALSYLGEMMRAESTLIVPDDIVGPAYVVCSEESSDERYEYPHPYVYEPQSGGD